MSKMVQDRTSVTIGCSYKSHTDFRLVPQSVTSIKQSDLA